MKNYTCLFVIFLFVGSSKMTMAEDTKVNKIIALLEAGKPVFGLFSGPKTPESAMEFTRNEADFVFYSMETGPFDVPGMQVYMQFLLDRKNIASNSMNEHPILTRIPPIRDGHDKAQEHVREILDVGVYGVVFPHVENAEEALHAVGSMRFKPEGLRSSADTVASRYWGISKDSYNGLADVWPLNTNGNLVNMLLIEDKVGVANAREIVSTEGVSIVIPGPGDLRRAYNGDAQAIESAIQTVLAACKEFDVPCGITAGPDDIEKRLQEGFRVFIVSGPEAIAVGRKASGR